MKNNDDMLTRQGDIYTLVDKDGYLVREDTNGERKKYLLEGEGGGGAADEGGVNGDALKTTGSSLIQLNVNSTTGPYFSTSKFESETRSYSVPAGETLEVDIPWTLEEEYQISPVDDLSLFLSYTPGYTDVGQDLNITFELFYNDVLIRKGRRPLRGSSSYYQVYEYNQEQFEDWTLNEVLHSDVINGMPGDSLIFKVFLNNPTFNQMRFSFQVSKQNELFGGDQNPHLNGLAKNIDYTSIHSIPTLGFTLRTLKENAGDKLIYYYESSSPAELNWYPQNMIFIDNEGLVESFNMAIGNDTSNIRQSYLCFETADNFTFTIEDYHGDALVNKQFDFQPNKKYFISYTYNGRPIIFWTELESRNS
jgi:hypothetical protein